MIESENHKFAYAILTVLCTRSKAIWVAVSLQLIKRGSRSGCWQTYVARNRNWKSTEYHLLKRGEKIKCGLPLAFYTVDLNNAQLQGVAWKTFTIGHLLRVNCILRMKELEDPSDRCKWTWCVLVSHSKKKVTPDGEEKKGKFCGRLPKLQQVDHTSAVDHNVAQLQCVSCAANWLEELDEPSYRCNRVNASWFRIPRWIEKKKKEEIRKLQQVKTNPKYSEVSKNPDDLNFRPETKTLVA